jgi:peptidoglycan hydrolase-like protein with peptidoglycan-binding domain
MPRRIRIKLSPLPSGLGSDGQSIADGALISFVTLGAGRSALVPEKPTPAKLKLVARFVDSIRTENDEETRELATLEGKLSAGRNFATTLRFEGALGDKGKPVGLVPAAPSDDAHPAAAKDGDAAEPDHSEIRLFRFAFDPAQFQQVPDDPMTLRVRVDPKRFHYCEVEAKLEIDGASEAGDENDILDVLITPRNPAVAPGETRRARLVGLIFDADKCFPLPQALPGIKTIVELHNERAADKVVVVGHAESDEVAGGPELSLARAKMMAAYLTDDPKPWLEWFGRDKPLRARWGTREVQLMLGAVQDGNKPFYDGYPAGVTNSATKDAIKRFQKAKGLKVDAVVGPKTQQALVDAYLKLEGTTFSQGVAVEAYGCQGHTDDSLSESGLEPDDRRVEVFFFDGAITPRPHDHLIPEGAPEYPAWRGALVETRDFENHGIHAQIVDVLDQPVPGADVTLEGPTTDKGVSDEHGFVSFFGVKKGDYSISAERTGYQIATQTLSYPTARTDPGHPKTAVRRVRMLGMLFDADKCFLLPQALPAVRLMVEMHKKYPHARLLSLGHASGDEVLAGPDLALLRAKALRDYLINDVDAWVKQFSGKRTARLHWGTREVQLMLSALPEGSPQYAGYPSGITDDKTLAAIKSYQKSKGLVVDGKVGPKTLKALVTDYMALEGTTLEKGTKIEVYGVQGHVEDAPTKEGVVVDDRRVELYFFDQEIDPLPKEPVLKEPAQVFAAWTAKVVETVDFENHGIHIQIADVRDKPVPRASVKLSGPTTGEAIADEYGFVSFFDLVDGEYEISAHCAGYQIGSQKLTYPTGKTVSGVSAPDKKGGSR